MAQRLACPEPTFGLRLVQLLLPAEYAMARMHNMTRIAAALQAENQDLAARSASLLERQVGASFSVQNYL